MNHFDDSTATAVGVRRGYVLLADDDPAVAIMYKRKLEAEGWDVHLAADGVAALEAAELAPPAMILLDVRMPRLSGLEALAALRARQGTARVPVAILSNSSDRTKMAEAEVLGSVGWLVKSQTTPAQLCTLVRMWTIRGD